MQPTLVLSAPHPGILYINGRFAGEISNADPLYRPVSSRGAVYLDYRPLSGDCESLARKLVFSGGEPMAQSVEEAGDLNVVIWPGGTVEIELTPALRASPKRFEAGGHDFTLDQGRLLRDGKLLATLPPDAEIPDFQRIGMCAVFTGSAESGRYLLALNEDFSAQRGFLQARQLDLQPDGRIRALAEAGDIVGHATLENWQLTNDGLLLLSSESAWAYGTPRWPDTPARTARAAVEALLLNLDSEAEGYLSPTLRAGCDFSALRASCDLCVEMKYAPPDSRPCVGLLQLQGDRLARVRPLYYRAIASGGVQGPWWIDEFEPG